MKTTLHLTTLLLFSGAPLLSVKAQITATPLDLSAGEGRPHYISAPSHDVAYAGVSGGSFNSRTFCRTVDAGESWTRTLIPEPIDRGCMSVFALNDTVVWASLSDGVGSNGGAIWRTDNGGTNWEQLTTTEFAGGFLNFTYFTTLDSGMAVGDPNSGYFEIYTTVDGGATWARTPQADIPDPLAGEYAFAHDYSAIGQHIWFDTNKGRILMSDDLGLHWTLSPIPAGAPSSANVSFADALHGASHHVLSYSAAYITDDGGLSWTPQSISPSLQVSYICAIPEVPGAFVFTAQGPTRVCATTDNFQSYTVLGTDPNYSPTTSFCMYDGSIGWLSTFQTYSDHAMYRIEDATTGMTGVDASNTSALRIFPNPATAGAALVTVEMDAASHGTVRLTDMQGRLVRSLPLKDGGPKRSLILDLQGVPAGTYVLTFETGALRTAQRLVVQ
ncbi:MAG: T9SS type A sorting domain-containing protein [Flavobacteriales bacterium]